MGVQGVAVGPLVKRIGDRATMVFGLFGGAVGIACMGLAPNGLMFLLAMIPNALWGLAMPTLQSLMTQHVSESEQGQLQGANMSVASIAGVVSPLFFGAVYAWTVRPGLPISFSGIAFLIAARRAACLSADRLGGRPPGRAQGSRARPNRFSGRSHFSQAMPERRMTFCALPL